MICMNKPSEFTDNGVSFDNHIKVDHEMWLYPNYIKYLMTKDESEFNGDELAVWRAYKSGSDDWMPKYFTEYIKVRKIPKSL